MRCMVMVCVLVVFTSLGAMERRGYDCEEEKFLKFYSRKVLTGKREDLLKKVLKRRFVARMPEDSGVKDEEGYDASLDELEEKLRFFRGKMPHLKI